MGLFSVGIELFKDEGSRKLIATVVLGLCITSLAITAAVITKDVAYIKNAMDTMLLLGGGFFTANTIEGIRKSIESVKTAKITTPQEEKQ